MSSESTLNEKIERRKKLIERRQELLNSNKVPSNRIPTVYGSFGRDSRSIARYSLLLNNSASKSAMDWFKRASEHYLCKVREARERRHLLEKSYEENEPLMVRDALEAALLSRDVNQRHDAAEVAIEIDDSYPQTFPETTPWYYYVKGVAALIRGADEEATEYIAHLQNDLDVFSGDLYLEYEGLATVLTGLINNDPGTVKTGFAVVFEHHERTTANSDRVDAAVCWPAMALRELVRRRGIDAEIESEYLVDY